MLLSTRETVHDRASISASRWVVFRCGDGRYGLPATGAREILEPGPTVRVPGCGPEVAGLATVRGRVVSVFDLRRLIGDPAADGDPQLLVCGDGGREVGLLVDRVLAVAPSRIVEAADPTPDARLPVVGEGRFEERPFSALDMERLYVYLFD